MSMQEKLNIGEHKRIKREWTALLLLQSGKARLHSGIRGVYTRISDIVPT